MRIPVKRSRYGAQKTIVDGITFDSKHEAAYYNDLKLKKRAGLITDFKLHPKYIIIDSYRCPLTGRKIPATTYSAFCSNLVAVHCLPFRSIRLDP